MEENYINIGKIKIELFQEISKNIITDEVILTSERFLHIIEKHKEDKDYIKEFGISYATEQCQQLIDNGVRGLHFYTLNKAHATSEILCNLI